jgi:GntR family transcriptional regulator / MocR family aminotransferase
MSSMPIEWAGLGPELLLRLDRASDRPLRVQLEQELRDAIRSGRLAAGERLPSSRAMAAELGVSRGLVLECYGQLQAEGFLSSRSGSATRVAANALVLSAPSAPPAPPPRLDVNFLPGVPDLTSFPRRDWSWALREACRTAGPADLGYGDPRGSEVVRGVLAGYLRRVRGTIANPDQIVICAGFGQGINLVLQTLADIGVGRVAIEDPGDDDYLVICRRLGVEAVPVPIDDRGIDVDALAQTDVRAVILTPTHQFPTGMSLAPERRQALIAWADERNATIVEDDYDAEFRYDRAPVGALQGLAPERVALIGTVSKSLAPTLRLGWVLCPTALLEALVEEKRLSDRGSPTLEQLALAAMIESGRYDRHLRHMRRVYRARRETLIGALAEHAPHVRLHGLAAGFHGVVDLPDGADERAIVEQARARSIGLDGMSEYRPSGLGGPPQLVLGFGNLTEAAIERGVAAIADLL